MRNRIAVAAAGAVATITVFAVAAVAVTGSGRAQSPHWMAAPGSSQPGTTSPSTASPNTTSPSTTSSGAAGAAGCATGTAWSCDQQRRFAAAQALLATKPGKLAAIVGDLRAGATWRAGPTTNVTWTASTIKVAIATALLEWHRTGRIKLDTTDRSNIHAALVASSNDATTALWNRYAGQSMLDVFRNSYGMSSLSVVPGYDLFWRHLRCSAEDLYQLMSYVLTKAPADIRGFLVGELRMVDTAQHWGVWAAGSAMRPGNKDGWAQKPDPGGTHWVTHTAGFAGQDERYVVVVTYSLPPSGTLSEGTQTVSDLVATVFGAPVPAKISTP
jgi:hypothetical protein